MSKTFSKSYLYLNGIPREVLLAEQEEKTIFQLSPINKCLCLFFFLCLFAAVEHSLRRLFDVHVRVRFGILLPGDLRRRGGQQQRQPGLDVTHHRTKVHDNK